MGNDFYEPETRTGADAPQGIGMDCRIERAIIDKNVRIGNNLTSLPFGTEQTTTAHFSVRDGVIVIHKGVTLPDNTLIGERGQQGLSAYQVNIALTPLPSTEAHHNMAECNSSLTPYKLSDYGEPLPVFWLILAICMNVPIKLRDIGESPKPEFRTDHLILQIVTSA